jgi:hypothetical protein
MSERTYGLMIGRTARRDSADVQPRAGRTARVWQGNPIFTNRPIALVSLL